MQFLLKIFWVLDSMSIETGIGNATCLFRSGHFIDFLAEDFYLLETAPHLKGLGFHNMMFLC